jgi:hypothetical protein
VSSCDAPPVVAPDHFTMMPYLAFAHLSDYDIEAIYANLMSEPDFHQSQSRAAYGRSQTSRTIAWRALTHCALPPALY